MSCDVISDNWSLQEISELLTEGLSKENSHSINIENNTHLYVPVASSIIQTESLFDFITDLILRNTIIVDQNFTNAWQHSDSPIILAKKAGVIREYPFLVEEDKLEKPREHIVKKLCVTQSLKNDHRENEKEWKKNRRVAHSLLSSTLWGGAGMMARSFVYERNYTPHPLRKRLLLNTGVFLDSDDAVIRVNSLINEKRLMLIEKSSGTGKLYSMFVNLPSLPIKVIQESASSTDLVRIALEMRDDFQEFREWLNTFQIAITNEDINQLKKHGDLLESVSNHIDSKIGKQSSQPISMSMGIGILKFTMKGDPINTLRNQFGTRSTINKLVFEKAGKKALNKYLTMFGEKNSSIGYAVRQNYQIQG